MRQSACLVINSVTVDNFAALFDCHGSGVSLYDGPDLKLFGPELWSVALSTDDLFLLQISSGIVWRSKDL